MAKKKEEIVSIMNAKKRSINVHNKRLGIGERRENVRYDQEIQNLEQHGYIDIVGA